MRPKRVGRRVGTEDRRCLVLYDVGLSLQALLMQMVKSGECGSSQYINTITPSFFCPRSPKYLLDVVGVGQPILSVDRRHAGVRDETIDGERLTDVPTASATPPYLNASCSIYASKCYKIYCEYASDS